MNAAAYISFGELLAWVGEGRDGYLRKALTLNRERGGGGSYAHVRLGGGQRGESRVYFCVSALPAGMRERIDMERAELWTVQGNVAIPITTGTPQTGGVEATALLPAPVAQRSPSEWEPALTQLKVWVGKYELATDKQFFDTYYTHKEAGEMTTAAAILRFLSGITGAKQVKTLSIEGVLTKSDLELLVLEYLRVCPLKGLRVSNLRVLKRKQQKFLKEGAQCVITGLMSNKNPQKLTESAIDLIVSLYAGWDGIKRTMAGVYRDYRAVQAEKMTWVDTESGEILTCYLPEVCYETIKTLVSNPVVREGIFRVRHGEKYAADFLRWYIHRKPPTYSMSLSSSDGWIMPFYVKKGDKVVGKNVARHVGYVIFEVKTGAILGYSYGGRENNALALSAFSDMVQTAYREYGGVIPIQNQLDNAGKGMKKELEQVFRDVHYCEPYRGQSKKAERYIGALEQMICRELPGWTGGNAGGKTHDFQRNPDGEDIGYTEAEGKELLEGIVKRWNDWIEEGETETRTEKVRKYMNPNATAANLYFCALALGKEAVVTVRNSGGFQITCQTNRKRTTKQYYLPQYNQLLPRFRNDYRVRVVWLDWYEQTLWVFRFEDERNRDGDILLGEAKPVPLVSAASAEWTPEDTTAMAEQTAHKTRTDRRRNEFEQGIKKYKILAADTPETLPDAEQMEVVSVYDTGQDKYDVANFKSLKKVKGTNEILFID